MGVGFGQIAKLAKRSDAHFSKTLDFSSPSSCTLRNRVNNSTFKHFQAIGAPTLFRIVSSMSMIFFTGLLPIICALRDTLILAFVVLPIHARPLFSKRLLGCMSESLEKLSTMLQEDCISTPPNYIQIRAL